MAIQHRRGADVDFKPDRMKAGELALTTDGTRKMYAAFAPGDVKEVAFKEDIPEGGGGGGSFEQVQPDYAQTDSTQPDYIKNKLVGKEVEDFEIIPEQTSSFTEQSDGSIGASLTLNEMPTVGEIYSVTYEGGEYEVEALDFFGFAIIGDPYHMGMGEEMVYPFLIIFVEGTASAIVSGKTAGDTMTISIKIKTEVTKKLTAEYLEPFEVVTKGGDTLTWDGDTSGLDACKYTEGIMFYRVSDATPTLNDFAEGTKLGVTMGGETQYQDVDISKIGQDKNLILDPTSMSFIICLEDGTPYGNGVLNKGLYFMDMSEDGVFFSSLTIPNYTGFTTTEKKLKGEYVIDTNSIILKSSGGKRFKVTVSDAGTLTATEI